MQILISRLQDCKIKIAGLQDYLRAIFQKVEFRVLFGVLVKVFSEFWVRVEMRADDCDVDILISRLHDCKIISNKFCIFPSLNTLPFGPPCPAGVI